MSVPSDEPIAHALELVRRLASADPTVLAERDATIAAIDGLRAALEARPSSPSTARTRARLSALLGALRGCTAVGAGVPREVVAAARPCLIPVPVGGSAPRELPRHPDRPLPRARALVMGGRGRDDAYPGDVHLAIQGAMEILREASGALVVFVIDARGQPIACAGSIEPGTETGFARLGTRAGKSLREAEPRATVVDEDGTGLHIECVGGLLVVVMFDAQCVDLAAHTRAMHQDVSRILATCDPFPALDQRALEDLFGLDDDEPIATP